MTTQSSELSSTRCLVWHSCVVDQRPASSALVEADIGVFAGAACFAVAPVGEEIELAFLSWRAIDVRPSPRIVGYCFLQVGAQRLEPFLASRVAPRVEPILVQRFLEGLDLRLRHLDLGLPHLREVARRYVSREQADNDDDDEQLQQREATIWIGSNTKFHEFPVLFSTNGSSPLLYAGAMPGSSVQ